MHRGERRKSRRKKRNQAQLTWSPARRRLLLAIQESAAAGKCSTQKDLAAIAGVSESQVSRWNLDPLWREAVAVEMRNALRNSAWLRAEYAAAGRAQRGSLLDWRLYLENGGSTSWREASTQTSPTQTPAAGGPTGITEDRVKFINGMEVRVMTINGQTIETYGIPQMASRSTLPPPVVDHANETDPQR